MELENTSKVVKQRQTIYGFLKRIYESELPGEFLVQLRGKMQPLLVIAEQLPSVEEKEIVKGLVQFTESISSDALDRLETRLAADYARLFLSINKVPPHPSESTYREGALMQHYRDEVLETYWSFRVDKSKEYVEPEDHIAVELGFMMYLCQKTNHALEEKDVEEARKYLTAQKNFLEKHLTRWVPKLVKDVIVSAQTPFYKGIAVLTREYLELDLLAVIELFELLDE